MKKVQNAKGQEKALDELYRRYEGRGMTYDHSPEYTEQKSREGRKKRRSSRQNKNKNRNDPRLRLAHNQGSLLFTLDI